MGAADEHGYEDEGVLVVVVDGNGAAIDAAVVVFRDVDVSAIDAGVGSIRLNVSMDVVVVSMPQSVVVVPVP